MNLALQNKKKPILREAFWPFLCFFILYLFSLASNLSAAHDSIVYLNVLDQGDPLNFHPHHLLFYPLMGFFLKLFSFLPSQYIVEGVNAFFGAITIAVFYMILRRRIKLSVSESWLFTLLGGTSFGIWAYSTQVEVYMIPLCFCMASLWRASKNHLKGEDVYAIGIFHLLAILFHQSHVLLILPIFYLLFYQIRERKVSHMIRYLCIVGGGSFFIYLGVGIFLLDIDSFFQMKSWIIGYAQTDQFWLAPGLTSILKAAIGFGRSLIGGHFLFAFLDESNPKFGGHNLRDEAFLVQDMGEGMANFYAVLSLLFLAMVGYFLIKILRKVGKGLVREHLFKAFLICFFSYSLFFLFWVPENLEFWLLQALCFWLLLAYGSEYAGLFEQRKSLYPLALSVLCLFIVNFGASISRLSQWEYDYYYVVSRDFHQAFEEPGIFVLEEDWILPDYLERFTDWEIWVLPKISLEKSDEEMLRELTSRNQVIYFTESVLASMSIPLTPIQEKDLILGKLYLIPNFE
ncbi:MAG: glycosyltransferase family 39 protein [Bacteroidota bacterium]